MYCALARRPFELINCFIIILFFFHHKETLQLSGSLSHDLQMEGLKNKKARAMSGTLQNEELYEGIN